MFTKIIVLLWIASMFFIAFTSVDEHKRWIQEQKEKVEISEKTTNQLNNYFSNDEEKDVDASDSQELSQWSVIKLARQQKVPAYPRIKWILRNDYQLTFFDEFSTDELDGDIWSTKLPWWEWTKWGQKHYFVDTQDIDKEASINPYVFQEAILTIRGKKIPAPLQKFYDNKKYSSGIISSRSIFQSSNGYIEARMKLPRWQWLWAKLWMMYSRDKDAQRRIQLVESDIEKQNLIYQSYEGYVDSGRQIFTKEKQLEGEKYFNDFHIYALKWSPEKIEFFIDGNMTHSVGRELRTSEKKYLYASLELWWEDIQASMPAELKIDWIRVYEKK